MAALRMAGIISSALATVVIARTLGPAGSGQVAVALAFFVVLLELASLGVGIGATWLVSRKQWSAARASRTTMGAGLVLGSVAMLAGLGVHLFSPATAFGAVSTVDIAIVVVTLPFALASTYAAQIALADYRYGYAAAIPVAQSLSYIAGVAALAPSAGVRGALLALLASHLIAFTVTIVGRPGGGPRDSRDDWNQFRIAVRFGVRAYMANALALMTYRFDLFLLTATHGADEAGIYNVAVALSNLVWLIPASLSRVLFPRVSALGEETNSDVKRRAAELGGLRHTTLLVLTIGLGLAVAAPVIIEPVFGAEFKASVVPTLLLLPGAVGLGVGSVLYATLAGRGRPGYALRGAVIVTPLALLLYAGLVPPFGAAGAAAASSLAYCVSAVLAGMFLSRETPASVPSALIPSRSELADYTAAARRLVTFLRP